MSILRSLCLIVFLAAFWGLSGCADNGGSHSDGDVDWGEQQEWDDDPDVADNEVPEDGDREWDRVAIDLTLENGLVDQPAEHWQSRQWSQAIPALNEGIFPTGVTCILPFPTGDDGAYVGTDHGLYRFDGESQSFEKVDNPSEEADDFIVQAMDTDSTGTLWLISAAYLYSYQNGRFTQHVCEGISPYSLVVRGDMPTIGTSNGLYRWLGSACNKDSQPTGMIRKLAKANTTLYAALRRADGQPEVLIYDTTMWKTPVTHETGLLEGDIAGLTMNDEGQVIVFGENGLQEIDRHGAILQTYQAEPGGLPASSVTMARRDANGVLWASTERGIWRYNETLGRFQVFAGRRFLHDDALSTMGFDAAGSILAANRDGITLLANEEQTLEAKGQTLLTTLSERHIFGGFVRPLTLQDTAVFDGAGSDFLADEGLRTGLATAALSLQAASSLLDADKEQAATLARQAMNALLKLEDIPNSDGLLGRAVAEEGTMQGSVEGWADGYQGDWWTGASHEVYLGWFFGLSLYHDLLANDEDKQRIAAAMGRTATLIAQNNFQAVDANSQPVPGAQWSDEYVSGTAGGDDLGSLRALELSAMLRVAANITGEASLWDAYVNRAWDEDYLQIGALQSNPSELRKHNHQADLLTFMALYLLLRTEDVPEFRELVLRATSAAWPSRQAEANPFFNTLAALAGVEPSGQEDAWRSLNETPSSLLNWRQDSCWRQDIVASGDPARMDRVLSVFERPLLPFGSDPYLCADERLANLADDHPGALWEDDGVFYLLSYWLARHHGYLLPR